MRLSIEQIIVDPALYPRERVYAANVMALVHAIEAGETLPPIVVGKRDKAFVLLDGAHRLEAYRVLVRKDVAVIVSGVPPKEFFAEAVRLNAAHGLRLTEAEKISAADRLQDMGYRDAAISRIVMMPVDPIRKGLEGRATRPAVTRQKAHVPKVTALPVPAPHLSQISVPTGIDEQIVVIGRAYTLVKSGNLDLRSPRLLEVLRWLKSALSKVPIPEEKPA